MNFNADEIKEQMRMVLRHSQNLDEDTDINVDSLITEWLKNKESFINMLGGKLIYEFPVEIQFTLSEAAKRARIEEFASVVCDVYQNYDLSYFLIKTQDDFYTNKLSHKYTCPYGKTIPEGTKIIKAFKEFETDTETLRMLQDAASILIQENKVKGKLCFSVHPLDFLSLSENTYHWHSCHHLQGDYRAGNLSYMADNTSIICYLKGEENVKLPSFPEEVLWNSKKWRTLVFIHPQNKYMFAGRQYPFFSEYGLDYILQGLKTIDPCFNHFSDWRNDWDIKNPEIVTIRKRTIQIHDTVFKDTDLIVDNDENMAYNDLLKSSVYKAPYISINELASFDDGDNSITIGAPAICIHCGQEHIEYSNFMMCTECDLKYGVEFNDTVGFCAGCGRRIMLNDSYDIDGFDNFCQDCYEAYCFVCGRCGCVEFNDDKHWSKSRSMYICSNCYEEIIYEEEEIEEEYESEEIENGSEGECCESDSN